MLEVAASRAAGSSFATVEHVNTSLRRLRSAVLWMCRTSGVLSLVSESGWRQRRLLIIGYHGVSIEDEHRWNPSLYISTDMFTSRLDAIRRGGYVVLPLDDALVQLKRGTLPKKSVVLTFDDGYYNFYSRAFPELRARQMPSTVYLTTYYSEFNRPIYNLAIAYVLWKAGARRWRPDNVNGFSGDFDLPAQASDAWTALVQHGFRYKLTGAEKDTLARAVADSLGIDLAAIERKRLLHLMTPEEVAELAREGVDFQMHTHRHRTPRDASYLARDLHDNEIRIEQFTGRRPLHFCYPRGDCHDVLSECLRLHDVRSATTCMPGLAHASTPALKLPRFIDTSIVSPLAFEGWLSGVQPLFSRPRAYIPAS
jgi:peptidoglycan/xylan/chitin deacetylase (PgdA/CDA1 family)